jgi:5,10-methylenetetrahydromethanopterin reductase
MNEQEAHATRRSDSVASVRVGVRLIQYLGSPAEIVDLAVHAEACGLDEVWVPHDPFMTSAWAVTSAIAARTERITIGSIGTNPYTTDPSEIAAYLGTLDLLSHGRAALGLGLHTEEMVRWLGYDVGDLAERLRASVTTVQALLRGEVVTAATGHSAWGEECRLRFEPLRPNPPVYVAAFGPDLLRLGGAIGDGVMPMATPPESVAALSRDIREGTTAAGRPPDEVEIIACAWLSIGSPDGPAATRLRQMIATFGPYFERRALATLGLVPETFAEIRKLVDAGRLAAAAAAVTPDMLRLALVGTAEEAAERITALGAEGVTNISLGGALGDDPREAIRLIGEGIAPLCRAS